MKKILLLMLIAALVFSCKTKQPLTSTRALETVDVGTAANDGTGDPLRTAFQKINTAIGVMNDVSLDQATGATGTGNLVYSASPTLTGTVILPTGTAASTSDINDTITARLAGGTVGVALADSNKYDGGYATPAWVDANAGGGNVTEQMLIFRVDDIGSPSAGDSIVIHNDFSGKVLDVYRDGDYQTPRFTATNTRYGYRLNGDTVTVNPVFQAGEDWVINVKDPVSRNLIALEGAENTLLDSLAVYYKLDETSGTVGDDANDIQNAVISTNTTASNLHVKFNYGRHIGYKGHIRVPYNVNVNPDGVFSVSMWIYADSIGTTSDYLFCITNNSTPYLTHRAYIDADGKIVFRTYNAVPTEYGSISTGALSEDTPYHVVLVHRGDTKTNLIYVNGVNVTTSQGGVNYTFSGTLHSTDGSIYFGNSAINGEANFRGYMDECGLWHQAFTPADVTLLNGITVSYPFTE